MKTLTRTRQSVSAKIRSLPLPEAFALATVATAARNIRNPRDARRATTKVMAVLATLAVLAGCGGRVADARTETEDEALQRIATAVCAMTHCQESWATCNDPGVIAEARGSLPMPCLSEYADAAERAAAECAHGVEPPECAR